MTLLGHPVVGKSWEGFVVENLISSSPEGSTPYFYRTSAGAEIDLVLQVPGGDIWAFEIKRSLSPRPRRGFHQAADDVGAGKRIVVYPGEEVYPAKHNITVMPLTACCRELRSLA